MLKRICLGAAFLVAAVAGGGATALADVTLVKDGEARAAVYVPGSVMAPDAKDAASLKNPALESELQRQRLRESVKDLALYLGKMSGAKVEVVAGEPNADDKRVPILIGEPAAKVFGPVAKPYRFKQAFRVVVGSKGVGLYGESDLASSYAVYELLDRLGCRWFMPSDMGEFVPALKTVVLKDLELETAPGTWYRSITYGDAAYMRRNRLGGLILNCGQILEYDSEGGSGYISKEQKAKHPEWRGAKADGTPMPERFKWSNPDLAAAVAASINARLDKAPELSLSLSPVDGAEFDESPQDKALDANDFEVTLQTTSLTDRLMVFCNRVAKPVAAKHPDVLLGVLAYVQFTRPPVREKVHPSIIPQIAPITYSHTHPMADDTVPQNKELRELVARWGKLCTATSYYAFGYHLAEVSAPYPLIGRWSSDVPYILANNCKFWQPETLPNFETSMHGLYLGTRLAFNPSLKPEEVVREINEKFYGSAAKEMTAYWSFIDDLWIKTPEYEGCGWAYLRRFPPKTMQKARQLLNAGLAAAKTDQEKFRVGLADDSLKLFELFMKMRYDQAEGRFENLSADSNTWCKQVLALGEKYKAQYCFAHVGWTPKTLNGNYFDAFYRASYDDASRIAREGQLLTPGTLRQWRYVFAKDAKPGEAAGYSKAEFDDQAWKTMDVAVDSWAALGHTYELGSIWYRTRVDLPAVPAGKKVFLWISATDGTAKVFVNGKHVPYVEVTQQPDKTKKTQTKDAADGYAVPFSFDITAAVKPGAANQITILGTKTTLVNEHGTGALLGPVAVYREK